MPDRTRIVAPGPRPETVRTEHGEILSAPASWTLLPPGDPGLTGRVKKAGPSWTVQEKRGRKLFSRGVWAPAATIEAIRAALAVEREDPSYARKLEAGRRKRAVDQERYEGDFSTPCFSFSDSHRCTRACPQLAQAIAGTPYPWAAERSPVPSASRSSSAPRPRRSRGCVMRPPPTTACDPARQRHATRGAPAARGAFTTAARTLSARRTDLGRRLHAAARLREPRA